VQSASRKRTQPVAKGLAVSLSVQKSADPSTGAKRQRIVVAMSGGVDSSVAAALLKAEGHDVIGITLQLYDHGEATGRKGSCCAGQDIQDARRVAELLEIPHYVLDYEKRFAAAVIETFAASYVAGETPIPCVNCNQDIKFRDLLVTARELGASHLATGHYIQKKDGPSGPQLYRGADSDRDQSYFLFATTPTQLDQLLFPIGGMNKSAVRQAAKDFGLPIADKADSQDICFVPKGKYADVIERLKPGALQPGDIVHVDGRKLGRHEGTINYTVGQRRGLKIPAAEPLYVIRIDANRNEVVVGPRDLLMTYGLVLRNVNWLDSSLASAAAAGQADIYARIRSTQSPSPATLRLSNEGTLTVVLHSGEEGVAAGQACVFYADGSAQSQILGGGWIARTLEPDRASFSARNLSGLPAAS
jgi:tRNA-uridine 2-sulfurtransferase